MTLWFPYQSCRMTMVLLEVVLNVCTCLQNYLVRRVGSNNIELFKVTSDSLSVPRWPHSPPNPPYVYTAGEETLCCWEKAMAVPHSQPIALFATPTGDFIKGTSNSYWLKTRKLGSPCISLPVVFQQHSHLTHRFYVREGRNPMVVRTQKLTRKRNQT